MPSEEGIQIASRYSPYLPWLSFIVLISLQYRRFLAEMDEYRYTIYHYSGY
jgi:hypothetical protein